MKFKVLRQHLGDRMYMPGDEREANEGDVGHLVDNGVLEAKRDAPAKSKKEPAPKNKAVSSAPKNKSAS